MLIISSTTTSSYLCDLSLKLDFNLPTRFSPAEDSIKIQNPDDSEISFMPICNLCVFFAAELHSLSFDLTMNDCWRELSGTHRTVWVMEFWVHDKISSPNQQIDCEWILYDVSIRLTAAAGCEAKWWVDLSTLVVARCYSKYENKSHRNPSRKCEYKISSSSIMSSHISDGWQVYSNRERERNRRILFEFYFFVYPFELHGRFIGIVFWILFEFHPENLLRSMTLSSAIVLRGGGAERCISNRKQWAEIAKWWKTFTLTKIERFFWLLSGTSTSKFIPSQIFRSFNLSSFHCFLLNLAFPPPPLKFAVRRSKES